jgi:hypothetical protein
MLFSGYICKESFEKCQREISVLHKEATNQSLNQKSRCFYIGAFVFEPDSARALCTDFMASDCNSYTRR